jgi:hypothetical protein
MRRQRFERVTVGRRSCLRRLETSRGKREAREQHVAQLYGRENVELRACRVVDPRDERLHPCRELARYLPEQCDVKLNAARFDLGKHADQRDLHRLVQLRLVVLSQCLSKLWDQPTHLLYRRGERAGLASRRRGRLS